MFVKAEGLRVLRVHIDRQVWMRGKSLMNKGFANTLSMLIRVDEKRLQMPFMQEHEAERRIRTINGKTQRYLRKKPRSSASMASRSSAARKSWVASTAARQISMTRGRSDGMEGRKSNMLRLYPHPHLSAMGRYAK